MLLKVNLTKSAVLFILIVFVLANVMVLLPMPTFAATQATYYVDPVGGNDSNNGTSAATAFATIAKARDVVRTVNSNMTGDIYVYLMNGMYTLGSTLEFGTADSGTNGYNVIYKAYTDAAPVISGGVDITTGWTLYDAAKNIYKRTGVNWNFRQLYVNEQRGIKARKPNLTDEVTGGPYLTATNNAYPYTVNSADIGSWANSGTAEMVVVNHWSQNRGRIASYSGNTVYFKSPESGFAYNHHNQSTVPYYFENAYELLDAEGEWFLDTQNTTLYYKPRTGETMNTTQITAPKLETLVKIEGTDNSNKVRNIQFYGSTFKYSNWLAPSSYGYVDVQAGFRYQTAGGGNNSEIRNTARYNAPASMLQLKYASNIKLDHNTFKYAGSWGVMGYEGTDNNSIVWNTFYKNAGGGIAMGIVGDQWDAYYDPSYVLPDGQSQYDTITDNTIDSIGLDYADAVGIGAMLPQNMTIARNEVKNLSYTGITIGWNWDDSDHSMTGNQVFSNNIHHVIKLLDDGGGIYSLGRMNGDTNFHHNYIHDIARSSSYSGGYPIAAIYFDNGSSYKTAENNVINNAENAFYAANPPNHDNIFQYNFSNVAWGNYGGNVFRNNTSVSGQSWPQAALDIMNAAGPGGTLPPTPTPSGVNVALNKTATASSEYSSTYSAAKAVDGDSTTTRWAAGFGKPAGEWWKVDLGSSQAIDNVIVKFEFNSGYRYNIDYSTDGTNWSSYAQQTVDSNAQAMQHKKSVTARYLRITFTQSGPGGSQSFYEFEAYSPLTNLALNKTATASSEYSSAYSAAKAVDGDPTTTRWAAGFGKPAGEWWKADLGSSQAINNVKVTFEMNSGYQFRIEYSTDNSSWSTYAQQTSDTTAQSMNYAVNVSARYLRITFTKLPSNGSQSIYEFEVY